jgi:hypothetical protein
MAYASIIGGLVQAGFSIYNQLSKPNPMAPLAQESSRINQAANKYLLPFANNPAYWNINVPDLAAQGLQFGMAYAPQINQFQMNQLQGLLGQALPGYQGIVNQMTTNAQQFMQGVVPTDVQQQIQRSAAFSSLMGGTAGAGTGTSGAITARDLGLTSLNLTQQGQQMGQNLIQMARNYLMPQPVNPASLLPVTDLINAAEWGKSATFQANEAAYTAKTNAAAAAVGAPQQGVAGGIGAALGGLFNQLGQKNPQTGQSGMQGIMGLFSSLFGGGSSGGSSGALFGGGTGSSADMAGLSAMEGT